MVAARRLQNLKNCRVWITGASSGIGQAMAKMASEAGARLYLFSSNENKLKIVADEFKENGAQSIYYKVIDLANPEVAGEIFKTVLLDEGVPDILVLNAGISQRSLAGETEAFVVHRIIRINFVSAAVLAGIMLPAMVKNGGGHIGVTGSVTGLFGFPLRSAYAASKHALHGFFETVDLEYAPLGIRVTIAVPGRIKTPISLSALTGNGTPHGKMDLGQLEGIDTHRCAEKYWKAILKGRRSVFIGRREWILIIFRRYLPGLFRFIARKIKEN